MEQYIITGNETDGYILEYNQGEHIINRAGDYLYGLSYDIRNNIKEVRLPESARVINTGCFENFSKLERVIGLENIEVIKDFAFRDCSELEKVNFGNVLEIIGKHAFSNCGKLKEIYIPDNVKCIEGHSFYRCRQLENVKLPQNLYVLEESTFEYCTNLKKINFPESLRKIEDSAFRDCVELKSVDLPKQLTDIGSYAFNHCGIETVTIPYNITYLSKVFNQCYNLKQVEFQNKSIKLRETFIGCVQLEDIGAQIFQGCTFNTFEDCPKIPEIRINERMLLDICYPSNPHYKALPSYPLSIYSISNPPSCPLTKYHKSETGWETQYEISENEFILHGFQLEDSVKGTFTIDKIGKFIYNPKYEMFAEINSVQDKLFLAVAYCEYDKRYKTYIRNHIIDILQYTGETEDFQLLTAIIDHSLISNRLTDKCLEFIRKEEYHEMFVMLTQYKEEQGGYSKKTNQERFDL